MSTLRIREPRFLTQAVAEQAVQHVLKTVMDDGHYIGQKLRGTMHCHVVVVVPCVVEGGESGNEFPGSRVKPFILYQHSHGDPNEWRRQFDDIARSKAEKLWQGRDDETAAVTVPHLLVEDDTPFSGGVKRSGIVVTCSGEQPHHDRLIAGMVADMCIALACDAWLTSEECGEGASFIYTSEATLDERQSEEEAAQRCTGISG